MDIPPNIALNNLQAVFMCERKQIHFRRNMQLTHSAQHRMMHFRNVLCRAQLRKKYGFRFNRGAI